MKAKLPKFKISKKPIYTVLNLPEGIEFWELFRYFEDRYDVCFLLESAGDNQYDSRYSVIGFDPKTIIRGEKGFLEINGEKFEVENPYYALRELTDYDSLSISYGGGLVGYLGYSCMQFFEPKLDLEPHPEFPAMLFGLYMDGLIFDKFTGELIYFDNGLNRLEEVRSILNRSLVPYDKLSPKVTVKLKKTGSEPRRT